MCHLSGANQKRRSKPPDETCDSAGVQPPVPQGMCGQPEESKPLQMSVVSTAILIGFVSTFLSSFSYSECSKIRIAYRQIAQHDFDRNRARCFQLTDAGEPAALVPRERVKAFLRVQTVFFSFEADSLITSGYSERPFFLLPNEPLIRSRFRPNF